ncbi:MAG: translation elongation factor Ts [Planctomycetaceae bacterium]
MATIPIGKSCCAASGMLERENQLLINTIRRVLVALDRMPDQLKWRLEELRELAEGRSETMAEISAQAVKELREITDLPMMTCKKALVDAGGDQKKAIQILKEQVGKVREKRAENATLEGRIFTLVREDGSEAAMVEVQCESAPVATGQNLSDFGSLLVKQLLEGPGAKNAEELLAQPAPDKSGRKLSELWDDIVNKIREKIVVNRVARVPGPVGAYVHHDGKNGVLFMATGANKTAPVLRDVAMHIAALRPSFTNPEDLDKAVVQAERDRLTAEAKKSGKPDNIIEKIVDGRMKTFYNDQGVLVAQPFAKDDSKTVSQALAEHGLTATSFERWVIGV